MQQCLFFYLFACGGDRFPNAVGPPDTTGAFIRNHAGANWIAWYTGTAVKSALVGIDLAQYDLGAITTRWHFPGPFTCLLGIAGEMYTCVVLAEPGLHDISGIRYHTDTPPLGILHIKRLLELCPGRRVAPFTYKFGVTVVQKETILC